MRNEVVAALAALCVVVVGACSEDEPPESAALPPASPTPEDPKCPLSGLEPKKASMLERPALAIKVENNSVAYPLSGLDKAEIVFEELAEGGITRFMAMYHCTDASRIGPVRSARFIDPDLMFPITRILAAAGGNAFVQERLRKDGVILLDEDNTGEAMDRVDRGAISFEHTLYGNSEQLRKLGAKRDDKAPPERMFRFGDLTGKSKKARKIHISFSPSANVTYKWKGGKWQRFDDGSPLKMSSGENIAVDNVIIEEHDLAYSKKMVDVRGSASVVFQDETGKGRAVLFRDGKALTGRWIRKSKGRAVRFETRNGKTMVFAPGSIWIELVPSPKGQVKGSFSFK